MKKKYFIFLVLIFIAFNTSSQLLHLKEDVKVSNHPRILLLQGEETTILKNIASDSNWKKIHLVILAESDRLLNQPVLERIQIGRRLLATSRECLRRIFYLSYSYRITNDKKYLTRAEEELVKVSQFSDWNPSHFLDVAEMTMGVAIGYDWLFKDLQQSSKEIIKEAILKKGIEPSLNSKYNYWLKNSNNWNQVCNAGMSYGALAIYEENPALARQIIDRAVESIKIPMGDYKPEGAYPEGYSYWGYGTSFNIMFISAIQKVFKTDFALSETEGFLKTAGYFQHMVGTSGKNFNYSDAGNGTDLSPAMFWFADRNKDNSLLYTENNYVNDSKSIGRDRLLPAAMIWGKDLSLNNAKAPEQFIWVGQGRNPVALMRTSWTDPDAIYVGFKTGSPSVSHGHMDVGSFVMDANGERWSMDFGMQEYESLESKGVNLWDMKQNSQRWQIFRYNNLAHSTLTFDNEFQKVEGKAGIQKFTANPKFISAISDISGVYKTKEVIRGIAIVDQKFVAVKDEIVADQNSTTVRWSMLTPAEVHIDTHASATLIHKGKKLHLKVVEPANATLKTWSTQGKNDFDAPNPGTTLIGFEAALSASSKTNLTILLIPEGTKTNIKQTIPALKDWK
ncbi:heparinase II/III family protein [Emticicia sp. BO119]|uniref:heparinase II/III domain-containing protein n=1 Tax=Emticicia sp. BO119 TaxID=2757768 RepID=UPI0015F0F900|nr:heparinase II/III family protein [Emticicia sp. BO119]MBA4849648.1 heparinase II/III family protein [Emticicia sp. BO119]